MKAFFLFTTYDSRFTAFDDSRFFLVARRLNYAQHAVADFEGEGCAAGPGAGAQLAGGGSRAGARREGRVIVFDVAGAQHSGVNVAVETRGEFDGERAAAETEGRAAPAPTIDGDAQPD